MSSEAGASPAILKTSWNKWRHKNLKVLIKFHGEVTKRKGHDNELESLKIMQSTAEWSLKEKNYLLGIVHSREFYNSKEIHRGITQDAPWNSFSKDYEKSQNCLLLCRAWMSFRRMTLFCILNSRKGVSGSAIFQQTS